MALSIRAPFWGVLIRAMVAPIAVYALGCSSDPGNSSTETGTPDSDSNACPKGGNSCGNPDSGVTETSETSSPDTGIAPDTSSDDTGSPVDSGVDSSADTSVVDSGSLDTGSSDTGVAADTGADTTVVDTGTMDSGSDVADTSPGDTGVSDTGTMDSGSPDTGTPDTGTVTASTLNCTGWTRDTSFDTVKLGGSDLERAPRVKGFGSNIYIATGTWGQGAVARKSGGSWTLETLTPTTSLVNGMDGTSETDLWIATQDLSTAQGRIYHRGSGGWIEDTSEPYAKAFVDVYAPTSTDVFVMGWKSTGYFVWKKTGTTWTAMTLPAIPAGSAFYRLWGLDANHVFLAGSTWSSDGTTPIQGLLYFYNGSTWSSLTVPSDFKLIQNIDGTSMDDLFLAGQTNSSGAYSGLIYHLTSSMGTWTRYADSAVTGYGGVWSPAPGLVLASGSANPDIAGSLRLTKMDKMGAPSTAPVDSKASGVQSFWVESDGVTVHFSHIAQPGVPPGHYVGTCTKS